MEKEKRFKLEAAGWGVWGVLALILVGPMIYYASTLVQKDTPGTVPVGIGVIFAAVVAALVTWIVNSVLQSIYNRKKLATRKQAKRKKQ